MTRKDEKDAAAAAAMEAQDGASSPQPQRMARGADKAQESGGKSLKAQKQQGKEQPRDVLYYTQKLQGPGCSFPPSQQTPAHRSHRQNGIR